LEITLPDLLSASQLLTQDFYGRQAIEVARDCLGKVLIHGAAAGRIVETEAYLGVDDLAAHSARGITPRTKVIFGPPGYAYIYFIYGMHECLNFVCEPEGQAGCVLIRALEPVAGLETMFRRRKKAKSVHELASGPGKLTQAMGITRKLNGSSLVDGPITVRRLEDEPAFKIDITPRIGITKCADWPLRFVLVE
jgi:DNA-3-methyladenine glycosylase